MAQRLLIAILLLVAAAVPAAGQNPDIVVGQIDFPSLRWGEREAVFDMTNTSERVKFVVVMVEIDFTGEYLSPNRRVRSHFAMAPGQTITARAAMIVPGNFGRAEARVEIYDVVDTLDIILPRQRVFMQPFTLNFNVPEPMRPYLEERINLPPRVRQHPYFDSEFSRILMMMLAEGHEPGEIAEMAICDTSFVLDLIEQFKQMAFIREIDGGYELNFPVIRAAEAEAAHRISQRTADSLADLVTANLPRFRKTLDSLVAAGEVNEDSTAFFDGGTILYREYPTVGALALWMDLGRSFITRSAPLLIYDGTDICNTIIPQYMYAVEGGPVVMGHHFYAHLSDPGGHEVVFCDSLPDIQCPPDFLRYRGIVGRVRWSFPDNAPPETFVMDTSTIRPALQALTSGSDPLLAATYEELKALAVEHGHARLDYGYRYWFWDLTASRVLDLLVERGVVSRRGNGQFQISGVEG